MQPQLVRERWKQSGVMRWRGWSDTLKEVDKAKDSASTSKDIKHTWGTLSELIPHESKRRRSGGGGNLEGERVEDLSGAQAWWLVRRRWGNKALNWLSTSGHSRDAKHQQNSLTSHRQRFYVHRWSPTHTHTHTLQHSLWWINLHYKNHVNLNLSKKNNSLRKQNQLGERSKQL